MEAPPRPRPEWTTLIACYLDSRIVEIDRRQLVSYPGNYARYLEAHAARQERLVEAEQKRRKLLARELEWLRRGAQARSTKQKARKERVHELMQIRYDSGEEVVSLALAGRCDAVLRLEGASAGADAEVERIRAMGGTVYRRLDDIPRADATYG